VSTRRDRCKGQGEDDVGDQLEAGGNRRGLVVGAGESDPAGMTPPTGIRKSLSTGSMRDVNWVRMGI
jgi:hypothetical protein